MNIITNNQPRFIVDASTLPIEQRESFDYIDWAAVEDGSESASFVQYKGSWYDLGEFMTVAGMGDPFAGWDGYSSDTYFSGILVKFADEDSVIMGRYYA